MNPTEIAEKYAKQMISNRGTPHWHDLMDCWIAGATYGRKTERERILELLNGEEARKSQSVVSLPNINTGEPMALGRHWAEWLEDQLKS